MTIFSFRIQTDEGSQIRSIQRTTALALALTLTQGSIALSSTPVSSTPVNPVRVTPAIVIPSANDTYRLGAGDHLDIAVFDAPELRRLRLLHPMER